MKKLLTILFLIVTVICTKAATNSLPLVSLQFYWSPVEHANLAGYNLYLFTNAPVMFTNQVGNGITSLTIPWAKATLSNVTNAIIPNFFCVGSNYWAFLVSRDNSDLESNPSPILQFAVPFNPTSFKVSR